MEQHRCVEMCRNCDRPPSNTLKAVMIDREAAAAARRLTKGNLYAESSRRRQVKPLACHVKAPQI